MYRWSDFLLRVPIDGQIILKNTLTGGVVRLNRNMFLRVEEWMRNPERISPPPYIDNLIGDTECIVSCDRAEALVWKNQFLQHRESANLFTLHFLPTLECQLNCGYCFENGPKRMPAMSLPVLAQSTAWIDRYLTLHPEIQVLRVILFGGEPLLEKELIGRALADFNAIAVAHGASFAVRITTNGELLDEEACEILRAYQWEKLQVTLDGPRELHDARRFGKKHRPTFDTIISNLERIAENSELSDIDLRITIDSENAESLSSLLDYLAALRWKDRLRLNLGFTTPSLNSDLIRSDQDYIADVAVSFWARAKAQGFRIPDEYVVGPWCVAIAKHSAVIQPNGALQKCFCTVGRHDYDFATVAEVPGPYAKDARFEGFERTDRCIEERCPYLPMCGGGCIHDALVSYGPGGFGRRFCQKKQISKINEGLIRLNYG